MIAIKMIFGEKKIFAIECEVTSYMDHWVYGCFIFWVHEVCIGNPADATDLKGCRNWLRDFVDHPRERYNPTLKDQSPEALFALIHFPAMLDAMPELDGFARFNIGHLGMSSFDRYDLLLVEFPYDGQMLIWREGDCGTIQNALLPAQQLQKVARKCIDWMCEAF